MCKKIQEMVWKIFAEVHLKQVKEFPVVFERFSLKKFTMLHPKEDVQLLISILPRVGSFEIIEGGWSVVTGTIRPLEKAKQDFEEEFTYHKNSIVLNQEDFYKECYLRKCRLQDYFQGIGETDLEGQKAKIRWKGKFDCFLDSMLQMRILKFPNKHNIFYPTFIREIVIDPKLFLEAAEADTGKHTVNFEIDFDNVTFLGFVVI